MARRLIARVSAKPLQGLLWAVSAALVVFHADLLAERLFDGSLAEPQVAARWLATAILLAWGAQLRRRGLGLFHGRHAVAFWILVVLLHAVPGTPLAPAVIWSLEAAASAPLAVAFALALAWIAAGRVAGPAEGARRRPSARLLAPPDPAIAGAAAPRGPPV